LIVLLLLGMGCGGSESTRLRGTTAVRVEAPAPTATSYDSRPSDRPIVGPAAQATAVEEGIRRAAAERGIEVTGDGRLGLLAAWTAEHLGDGGRPPPHEVVEFFSRHLGLIEPAPHLLILGQPDPEALAGSVTDSVRQFLERESYNFYGGAVVERQGLTLAVVTLSRRFADIEPLPRRLAVGQAIRLSGRLRDGYAGPVLAVALPSGEVIRRPAGDGPAFREEISTADSGVYTVELLADGPRGDTVLANFPLFVGVDVPTSVSLASDEGPGESASAEAVAAELHRLLNRTRTENGLAELDAHDGLARVALAHSQDMVESGFVGHDSPRTGSAVERVERAGFRSGLVLENIGRGYGAAEIHRGLLQSPGHRANVLNPDVTHVGVGVAAEEEGSRTAFVATEVFVRMAQEIDPGAAPAELLEMINRGRRARGARPLEADPNLAGAAAEAARRFFAEPTASRQDIVDDASASLRRFAIAWSRIGGLLTVVARIDEASRLEPTFDPEVRYVGIGVAQGSRPDSPSNSVAVVVLLAWPR
jgi:uncharacterized protein YkwD